VISQQVSQRYCRFYIYGKTALDLNSIYRICFKRNFNEDSATLFI